jgi:hypothetical protein
MKIWETSRKVAGRETPLNCSKSYVGRGKEEPLISVEPHDLAVYFQELFPIRNDRKR